MPQTKYVLKKSLEIGLDAIVVLNKIDRANARPDEVLNNVFDLFVELNASDEQLDFPVVYTSAKDGIAKYEIDDESDNLIPLFETIIKRVKDTEGNVDEPFQFLISAIEYDNYLGKIGTGKIYNGKVKVGDEVVLLKKNGDRLLFRVTMIFDYEGLSKIKVKEAFAGDIVSIAGTDRMNVGETIADEENPVPLPLINIDEPTVAITFKVNDSPMSGREGKFVTSRNIWERLQKELLTNVSLVVEKTDSTDSFIVKGRGELQLSILIENMRREGYEFQVSKPEVIYKDINGKIAEPIELAIIDVADEFVGVVIELFGKRKGEMIDMVQGGDGYTRLEFKVPVRGLMGFTNEFLTNTRGTGILNHSFYEYEFFKGEIEGRNRGVLIASEPGISSAFALNNLQSRGELFIGPGVEVYTGMIVGIHNKENDIVVNVCKGKRLTNMRAAGADEAIKLTRPLDFSLEQCLEFIGDDELLEITPKSIRMRKKILDEKTRKRQSKSYIKNHLKE
ncbi:translational GTPase TypA, partial [candidate division TA06 bacterium]